MANPEQTPSAQQEEKPSSKLAQIIGRVKSILSGPAETTFGEDYFEPGLKKIIKRSAESNYPSYTIWESEKYWQPVIKAIQEFVEEKKQLGQTNFTILDEGTAYGYLLKHLKALEEEVGVNFSRLGFDISRFALTKAKDESASASLVEHNLEDGLPIASGTLDIVVAADVVEHTRDRYTSIASISRVLKPGGLLIISVPVKDGLLGKIAWNLLDNDPSHVSVPTEKEIVQELLANGFEIQDRSTFYSAGKTRLPIPTNLEIVAVKY